MCTPEMIMTHLKNNKVITNDFLQKNKPIEYVKLKRIAFGTYGVVYKIYDSTKMSALKISFRCFYNPTITYRQINSLVDSSLLEVLISAYMSNLSINFLQVFNYWFHDNKYYINMEYANKKTLLNYIEGLMQTRCIDLENIRTYDDIRTMIDLEKVVTDKNNPNKTEAYEKLEDYKKYGLDMTDQWTNLNQYDPLIKSLVFQVIHGIYMMQDKYMIMHIDLKISNIMITQTKTTNPFVYFLEKKKYIIPNFGIIIKIIDFNTACKFSEPVIMPNTINDDFLISHGTYIPAYDILVFLISFVMTFKGYCSEWLLSIFNMIVKDEIKDAKSLKNYIKNNTNYYSRPTLDSYIHTITAKDICLSDAFN